MKQEETTGYVIAIDRWDWMMGKNRFVLDDIYAELAKPKLP